MKLPPRRVLRSIVEDAISDHEEMQDADMRDATKAYIASYRALLPRLADSAPPLTQQDREVLVDACRHARIWREGLVDSWRGTGDKATILSCRQDVDRVTRTQDALGVVRSFLEGGAVPDDMRSVSIFDLMRRHPEGCEGRFGWQPWTE